jgi:hypothetical protein
MRTVDLVPRRICRFRKSGKEKKSVHESFEVRGSQRELAHGHSPWSHQGGGLAWKASRVGVKS